MSAKKKITGEQALAAAFHTVDHKSLLEHFGVEIPDDLLTLALTHRSFANEHGHLPNNERLEFLGDAVLGLSIAGVLYNNFPSRPESDISKMRASIVSRFGLSEVAREIGLGAYIILGKGESASGGRDKDSLLADTMEALIGAVYLTFGFDIARDAVLRLFADKIKNATATGHHHDWKTTLQERVAERGLPMPVYGSSSVGPDHAQVFTATVRINDELAGTGQGHNKKLAEQQAAHQAVLALNDNLLLGK
ncbi:ribonuclease III [Corynebacterium kutscheri]|uniref:Ribonuclease 3 n=1 Tax=Corynebacterium kutscheri TaxID=35755 RepID=A0A0F6R0U5_9CORY|nr:ribonuclease III [Corynebacterium kutscheri]AKE41500.1 ribonuclease III [Corynebacterium kutscheri]VEH08778.1 ribonuclease III [Corynebacterium kutscheri]VEH09824.1 ribonuclease III [Corynebacterium kutscheri]VEH79907.1 ribonuclease III [Corynebacterium kutscheri]